MTAMNDETLQTVNERARLAFLKWIPLYEKQKPFQVFTSLPLGVPSTNLVFEDEELDIRNMRGQEHHFKLDEHAFQLCKADTHFTAFNDAAQIEEVYLPAVRVLIKEHVQGADKIVFFDWRVGLRLVSCFICTGFALLEPESA